MQDGPAGKAPPESTDRGCETPGVDCDVELAPPEHGAQFRVGPVEVPVGEEILRCYWQKVPEAIDVSRIQVRYNLGSHHLDLFTADVDMPDADFDCSRPSEWGAWPSEVERGYDHAAANLRIVVGFQNKKVDWELPEGVAFHLREGQQLMIQSHYANLGLQDTPTSRLLNYVNLYEAASAVEKQAETLFDEDDEIVLPARTSQTIVRYCEFPGEVNLVGLFGHFHSRGVRHRVYQADPESLESGKLLYESTSWDGPPFFTPEDWDGTPRVRAIRMVAEYQNLEDRDIRWGSFVGENEHFETYAMYYPALGVDARCICHREGEKPIGVEQHECE